MSAGSGCAPSLAAPSRPCSCPPAHLPTAAPPVIPFRVPLRGRPCRHLPLRGHPAAGKRAAPARGLGGEKGSNSACRPHSAWRAPSASGRRPDLPFGCMPPAFGRSPAECPAAPALPCLALPWTRRDPARSSARGGLSARQPPSIFQGGGGGGCSSCGGAFYTVIPAKLSWRRPERPGRGRGSSVPFLARAAAPGARPRRPAAPSGLRHRYYKPRARPAHGIL